MLPFWELTPDQRQFRLDQAIALSEQARQVVVGIGMRKERTLHSVLKFYFEPDADRQEIPVEPFIADIYHEDPQEVLEIQTGSVAPLREKLAAFLPQFPVTVVHPVIRKKRLYWSDPETGELSGGRLTSHTGTLAEILPELYRVSSLLSEPGLSFLPILLDVDEYRLTDGWNRDGKRGSHRIDRVPTAIGESVLLEKPEDYYAILPELPEIFTSREFGKAMRMQGRALSYSLSVLQKLGIVVRAENRGRQYQYRLAEPGRTEP